MHSANNRAWIASRGWGLLFDVVLGVLPSLLLLSYSGWAFLGGAFTLAQLSEWDVTEVGVMLGISFVGAAGLFACWALLAALVTALLGRDLKTLTACWVKWGLKVGVVLAALMAVFTVRAMGYEQRTDDLVVWLLSLVVLAPVPVALKYLKRV